MVVREIRSVGTRESDKFFSALLGNFYYTCSSCSFLSKTLAINEDITCRQQAKERSEKESLCRVVEG